MYIYDSNVLISEPVDLTQWEFFPLIEIHVLISSSENSTTLPPQSCRDEQQLA